MFHNQQTTGSQQDFGPVQNAAGQGAPVRRTTVEGQIWIPVTHLGLARNRIQGDVGC